MCCSFAVSFPALVDVVAVGVEVDARIRWRVVGVFAVLVACAAYACRPQVHHAMAVRAFMLDAALAFAQVTHVADGA